VSTIIATILMVAVTVVLAAVLYVLLTGLMGSGGVGQTPIGSAFTAGNRPTPGFCATGSSQVLGATSIMGGCKPGDFMYTLTVESSTVTFGSVLFKVEAASGLVFAGGGASSSFALLDPAGHVAAISVTGATMAMSTSWQGYGLTTTTPTYSSGTSLTNSLTIVIDMGSATPTTGEGLSFVAVGTGVFSGATYPIPLP
jgi:hypothetical protein